MWSHNVTQNSSHAWLEHNGVGPAAVGIARQLPQWWHDHHPATFLFSGERNMKHILSSMVAKGTTIYCGSFGLV